jgi:hypothetical protein
MRERVEELGGTLAVEAVSAGGTRVLARLPLEASGIRLQASGKDEEQNPKPNGLTEDNRGANTMSTTIQDDLKPDA